MVTEVIRYQLPEEKRPEFLEAYRMAARHLLADPHCQEVEVHASRDDPGAVLITIEWDSVAGHEQEFTDGPHFPPFIEIVRPFLRYVVEMAHYDRCW